MRRKAMTRISKLIRATAAVSLMFSAPAFAATQGTLGVASSGSARISATLNPVARVSNLNDLTLPAWNGSGDVAAYDDVCVYTNTAGGKYNVTVTGDGSGNAFTLTDGRNTMAYQVTWNTAASATGAKSLSSGRAERSLTGASTASTDCGAGASLNARLAVKVPEATLLATPAGTYTGAVTVTIAPE
jgi:hypothetical protein